MDAIVNFIFSAPVLVLVVVIVVAWLFARAGRPAPDAALRDEDRVPHYRRFERRESEMGDRRQSRQPVPEDQRKGSRRR